MYILPPKISPSATMSLKKFESLNAQLKKNHIQKSWFIILLAIDPLVLTNLNEYLNISLKYDLKLILQQLRII